MVVFSRLAVPASKLLRQGFQTGIVQIRKSGGGGIQQPASQWDSIFNIVPTRWNYLMFKDMLHFYVIIVATPLLAVIAYANICVGSAKLAAIPEGYEPKEWEYEPHPITRWFVRNIYMSEQERYERMLHVMWEDHREMNRGQLKAEVKRQMSLEGDYAAWYYKPSQAKYSRMWRQDRIDEKDRKGSF